jgi:hypothetical protein
MVTLEQYRAAAAARDRRTLYSTAVLLAFFVALLVAAPLGFGLLVRPYADAWNQAGAEWILRHDLSFGQTKVIGLLAVVLIAVPAGLVLALPLLGVLRLIERGSRADRRLFCPRCAAPLGYLVTVTGNCQQCGGRALDVPEGTTAAAGQDQHRLTVEEFNAAVRAPLLRGVPKHRDPRLRCPRCHAGLAERRWQVVATRKCPRCDGPVLEDPEATPPAGGAHPGDPRRSLADFRASYSAYGRWSLCRWLVLTSLAVVPWALVAWWETPLRRLLGSSGLEVLSFAAPVLVLSLAFWIAWLADRRSRRKLRLDCPHCGRSLMHPSRVVIATRRCYHCGRRALAEEAQMALA